MTLENKIKEKLNKIRPFLQRDGGDVELIYIKNNIAYVKVNGACKDCIFLDKTFNDEIRTLLLEEVKEIEDVKLIN